MRLAEPVFDLIHDLAEFVRFYPAYKVEDIFEMSWRLYCEMMAYRNEVVRIENKRIKNMEK